MNAVEVSKKHKDRNPVVAKEDTASILKVVKATRREEGVQNSSRSPSVVNRPVKHPDLEISRYLAGFKKQYRMSDIELLLDQMAKLRVLVVGDTIIDEYQYCQSIGKSSKDPTLALKYEKTDVFAGGAIAIANHIGQLAGQVDLYTVIGEQDSRREFIQEHLMENVKPRFFIQEGAPTIVKRRFIDSYTLTKLLEVYIMDDSGLGRKQDEYFTKSLGDSIGNYDVVVAADFGHGAISSKTMELMTTQSAFLAVNTQANAGNRGFHTISKYKKADYISIAEHELRLEMRDLTSPVKDLIGELYTRVEARNITITQGRKGCTVSDQSGRFADVPALARNVVDRVGSGDALLAITALAAKLDADKGMVGFLGNVNGALAVEMMGNQDAISRNRIKGFVRSLFDSAW